MKYPGAKTSMLKIQIARIASNIFILIQSSIQIQQYIFPKVENNEQKKSDLSRKQQQQQQQQEMQKNDFLECY